MRNLLPLLILWGCTPPPTNTCGVESELADFDPVCSQAVLSLYDDQSIMELPGGNNAVLAAYIEASPTIQAYGGESGNLLNVVLEIETESWTAVGRKTTLTVANIDEDTAELRIDAHFPDGLNVDGFGISGTFDARLLDLRLEAEDSGNTEDSGFSSD